MMDDNVRNITPKPGLKEILRPLRALIWLVAVVVAGTIVFSLCTYTVGEREQAIVTQFGVIKEMVLNPRNSFVEDNPDLMASKLGNVAVRYANGLQFKIPFIQDVVKYDSWLYTYTSNYEPVHTQEKKQYEITMYAQWRIANPALFYMTQQTLGRANNYLDDLVYPAIIQGINQLSADAFLSDKDELNRTLDNGLVYINQIVRSSGIEVADIEVHRTSLPNANLQSTYDRMIANRAAVAQQLRSEGMEEYQKSVSSADLQASIIESEAIRYAEKTRGEADAAAMDIYAKAYTIDPEFFTYWRSLQALDRAFDENTTLVLDKNHPLWKELLAWVQP